MKILCAWCEREGQPAEIGDREPLTDPSQTHGICGRHCRELIETVPSRSFPGVELLLVVPAGDTRLYRRLRRATAGVKGVEVILDRRRQERGVAEERSAGEPRLDRRLRSGASHPLGYIAVRLGKSQPGDG